MLRTPPRPRRPRERLQQQRAAMACVLKKILDFSVLRLEFPPERARTDTGTFLILAEVPKNANPSQASLHNLLSLFSLRVVVLALLLISRWMLVIIVLQDPSQPLAVKLMLQAHRAVPWQ